MIIVNLCTCLLICCTLLIAVTLVATVQCHSDTSSFSLITIFSTECNDYFDWQSESLLYSHSKVNQSGELIRLIACDHNNTYIEPHLRHIDTGSTNNDSISISSVLYPSYSYVYTPTYSSFLHSDGTYDHYLAANKPGSILYWLQNHWNQQQQYVLIAESDM